MQSANNVQRSIRIARETRKRIYGFFADNDVARASHYVERFNCFWLYAFPGETAKTLGNLLDDWYEQTIFEGRL